MENPTLHKVKKTGKKHCFPIKKDSIEIESPGILTNAGAFHNTMKKREIKRCTLLKP